MSEYGILILGLRGAFLETPEWLESFDLEAHDPHGPVPWLRGKMTSTLDPAKAMRFPDAETAFVFVRQQSKTAPLRPDGEPNRPLTAFTVQIEKIATKP